MQWKIYGGRITKGAARSRRDIERASEESVGETEFDHKSHCPSHSTLSHEACRRSGVPLDDADNVLAVWDDSVKISL